MHDELLSWRDEFPILERNVYLINNSLGAMPRAVRVELDRFATAWEERGVRAWHEGWWEMAVETGDLLAPILGVRAGEITMHQNVSLATALFLSAIDYPRRRNRIVTTALDFPTLGYLLEGEREKGAELVSAPSADGIGVESDDLVATIDRRTRLVVVSHVLFRSAFVLDAARLARRCREVGALLVLDVYQSVGAIPLRLAEWGIDAAVGGSVKFLCGGPGAAFLWVDPELAAALEPTVTGWQADREPFAFRPGPIERPDSAWRLLTGTPNVPALHSCRPGYRIIAEVGVERIRERSKSLTQELVDGVSRPEMRDLGFELRTPRDPERRGGAVTVRHERAEEIGEALLARDIICDVRPGSGIRLAPHFYNSVEECRTALEALDQLARRL